MKILKKIRNYFCYCGVEKDLYRKIKKDAYVSNFQVIILFWIHCLIC